jgi:hypothetical protein
VLRARQNLQGNAHSLCLSDQQPDSWTKWQHAPPTIEAGFWEKDYHLLLL